MKTRPMIKLQLHGSQGRRISKAVLCLVGYPFSKILCGYGKMRSGCGRAGKSAGQEGRSWLGSPVRHVDGRLRGSGRSRDEFGRGSVGVVLRKPRREALWMGCWAMRSVEGSSDVLLLRCGLGGLTSPEPPALNPFGEVALDHQLLLLQHASTRLSILRRHMVRA